MEDDLADLMQEVGYFCCGRYYLAEIKVKVYDTHFPASVCL